MVTIFVEGKADKRFLEDLITYKNENSGKYEIIPLGGKDKFGLTFQQFNTSTSKGYKNIVIFDADNDFEAARSNITNKAIEYNFQVDDIFLFPYNKKEYLGDLETLLLKITNEEHKDFFECFSLYENCLGTNSKFINPALKTKVYAFVDTLNTNRNLKIASEEYRDYKNEYFWNLDSEELIPLLEFLKKQLDLKI